MADEYKNQKFLVAGMALKCLHCKHDHFDSRVFYMEPNLWFFRDYAPSQVAVRVFGCVHCGRLEHFLGDKIETAEEIPAGPTRVCEGCGLSLDEDLKTCPACQMTRKD